MRSSLALREPDVSEKKTPKLPTWKTVTAEKRFIHQIDWWTFLLLVEQVGFSPFYFFWLICTFQAEMHKSVFHSHVLIKKSLNARLYLLLCLSPLSYRKCPCLIKSWIWLIVVSWFFLTPSQGSWTLLGSTFNKSVFSRSEPRREPGYEDDSVPPDKACSHLTPVHGLKWARFWLWLAQEG